MSSNNVDLTAFTEALQDLSFSKDTLVEEFREFVTSRPSLQSIQSVRSAIKRAKLDTDVSSAASRVFDNLAHDVMSYLPLQDLLRLGNTNRCLRAQVPSHLTRALHALLQKYFPHPAAFRDIMRETGAVISGSSVLSLITRDEQWTPRDLDIYAPKGEPTRKLQKHLHAVQGFQLKPIGNTGMHGPIHEDYVQIGSHHIRTISKFTKNQHEAEDEKNDENQNPVILSVDLIESSTASAVQPITFYHSTIVMNYITADAIVVLYPSLTFSRIGVTQGLIGAGLHWPEKYRARGFSLLETTIELGTKCGSACPRLTRASCDIDSLRVSLGVYSSPSEHDCEAWLATWKLGERLRHPPNGCHNAICPYRDLPPYNPWIL